MQAANPAEICDAPYTPLAQRRPQPAGRQESTLIIIEIAVPQGDIAPVIVQHRCLQFRILVDPLLQPFDQSARLLPVNTVVDRRVYQPEQGRKGLALHQRSHANNDGLTVRVTNGHLPQSAGFTPQQLPDPEPDMFAYQHRVAHIL